MANLDWTLCQMRLLATVVCIDNFICWVWFKELTEKDFPSKESTTVMSWQWGCNGETRCIARALELPSGLVCLLVTSSQTSRSHCGRWISFWTPLSGLVWKASSKTMPLYSLKRLAFPSALKTFTDLFNLFSVIISYCTYPAPAFSGQQLRVLLSACHVDGRIE